MNVHFSSKSSEWRTPLNLLEGYVYRFAPVDLDPCSADSHVNAKRYYTEAENGLIQPWHGFVFMNPPYGREVGNWCEKAASEAVDDTTVIGLLPGRVDTQWFHDHVFSKAKAVVFIKGRLTFEGAVNGAPFPSCLVLWGESSEAVGRFKDIFAELGHFVRL